MDHVWATILYLHVNIGWIYRKERRDKLKISIRVNQGSLWHTHTHTHTPIRVETPCHCHAYRREENFRELNILYFNFTFGFNFCIVRYTHIQYSIAQNFSFGFNFRMHFNLWKKSIRKNQPYVGLMEATTVTLENKLVFQYEFNYMVFSWQGTSPGHCTKCTLNVAVL